MKRIVGVLKERFERLSQRERWLVGFAFGLALFFFAWTSAIEPAATRFQRLKGAIPLKQRQIRDLAANIQEVQESRQRIAQILSSAQKAAGKPSPAAEMQAIIAKLELGENLGDMLAAEPKPFLDISSEPLEVRLSQVPPEKLLTLLRELDGAWPRINVQSFSARRNRENAETLDISLGLTFLRPKT